MRKKYLLLFTKSIGFKLLLSIFLCVLPMVFLLTYNNFHSRNVLLSQIENTHRNMLQIYVSQLDRQLDDASSYLLNLALYENDTQLIANSTNETAVKLATMRVKKNMDEKLLKSGFLDGYFLYADGLNGQNTFYNCVNGNHSVTAGSDLKNFLAGTAIPEYSGSVWQFVMFGDTEYLFLIAGKDGLYAGAYVSLENLLSQFAPGELEGSWLSVVPAETKEEYIKTFDSSIRSIFAASDSAALLFAEHIPQNTILKTIPMMWRYTWLVNLLLLLLIILLLLSVRHFVSDPLLRLTDAMHHIESGDLEYRMPMERTSAELNLVSSTFNQMTEEIQHLKIDIYERELAVQKSQLLNLQLQIKPHFLINSLNMVYNLISTDKIPLACRLIRHSIDFFRFMVRVDENLVSLYEEAEHVKAYLDIQSVRYEDSFTYSFTIDHSIDDMLIPPVLIQGLVENSMKYALSPDKILHINIRVSSFEKDYFPYAEIQVSDNGPGFPENILETINRGAKVRKEDGPHTGLSNTTQRLHFLFGDKAEWHFENREGAFCSFTLPATFPDNDTMDEKEI